MLNAITLWQPWAYYIAKSTKRVENRTWEPPAHLIGKPLAIHAGKSYDVEAAIRVKAELGIELPEAIPFSAIVAVGILDRVVWGGVVEAAGDPWFSGPCGWYLRDVVAIEPVPCRGAQRIWTVPASVTEQVRARYKAAKGGG